MRITLADLAAACLLLCSACSKSKIPPDPARVPSARADAAPAITAPAPPSATVGELARAEAPLARVDRPRSERTRRFVRVPTGDPPSEPKRVPTEDMDVATLAPLHAARDTRLDHFQFEGFDADWLVFVFVRRPPFEGTKRRLRVDRRVRVARSAEAERALHVERTVDFFEVGQAGVRGGMSADEVIRTLGAPLAESSLGAFGNCDFVYRDRTVRFLQNRVAHVSAPVPELVSAGSTRGNCAGRLGR